MSNNFKMSIVSKEVQEGETVYKILASDNSVDRDREVTLASGWNLENFNKHPVVLANHIFKVENQIGKVINSEIKEDGLYQDVVLYKGKGNGLADWCSFLAEEGMAGFSVTYIPGEYTVDINHPAFVPYVNAETRPRIIVLEQELLEVSMIAIPSIADALQIKGIDKEKVIYVAKSYKPDEAEYYEWKILKKEKGANVPLIERLIRIEIKKQLDLPKTPQNVEISKDKVLLDMFGYKL